MSKHIQFAAVSFVGVFTLLAGLAFLQAQATADAQAAAKTRLAEEAQALVAAHPELAYPAIDDEVPGAGPLRRYDQQVKTWMTRRLHFANRGEQDNGAVVFYGDSITQGWGDDFRKLFPGVHLANRGISGDTSRGLLLRLEKDVLSLKPKAMVILIGTNDMADGIEPEAIANNIKLLLSEIKKSRQTMPIVLCQVFPSHASKQRPADKIKKLNELYFEVVKGDPQVTLLDTWTFFAQPDGDCIPTYFPDLLHLNDQGYAKWASAIRPIFTTLQLDAHQSDEFVMEEGFRSLVNGKDLSGWEYRDFKTHNLIEDLDSKQQTSDARFRAIGNGITSATAPEGRKAVTVWTKEVFPTNFVLRLQFRATPNADGGVFIRKPQLQCRDYTLAGPFKDLKQYKPQEWNDLEVTVNGTTAHCTCNGEVLQSEMKVPETGPIGLEGDRGQMEYRYIRVKELPSEDNL